MPEKTTHQVAVVVFCEIETNLLEDAEVVAALAVRRALAGPSGGWPAEISTTAYQTTFPGRAVRVVEAGMAGGNGYLWLKPTAKAYREAGEI